MRKSKSPKKLLKSTRDKFHADITSDLRDVKVQLAELQKRQLQTVAIQTEMLKRQANSGYVQISKNEIMTKIFSGAKMYLDPRDVGLVPHLILDGEWERDITQAWLTTLKPKDVVLDIGANFGYFGVLASQQTNKDCRVIMFEANPQLIPYLSKTVNVNSFDECATVENLAVSDKKGKITLNVLKDYIASSSVKSVSELNKFNTNGVNYELEAAVDVPATTIDIYCQNNKISNVNVIKMDIEGHEDKAYQGMRNIVKSSPDITLFIEFTKHAYDDPEAFYKKMLADFGNVFQIDNNGKIVRPKNRSYKAVIGESDNWSMPIFSKNKNLANT